MERKVGASHGGMPIMHMQNIGAPSIVQLTRRQMRRYPAQQSKALGIVWPLAAIRSLIRIPNAIVKIRRINDIGLKLVS